MQAASSERHARCVDAERGIATCGVRGEMSASHRARDCNVNRRSIRGSMLQSRAKLVPTRRRLIFITPAQASYLDELIPQWTAQSSCERLCDNRETTNVAVCDRPVPAKHEPAMTGWVFHFRSESKATSVPATLRKARIVTASLELPYLQRLRPIVPSRCIRAVDIGSSEY